MIMIRVSKKILFLICLGVIVLVISSACLGYGWGSNFDYGGYPSFDAYRPTPPSVFIGDVEEYQLTCYRNEVESFQNEAEEYINNAENDIESIQNAAEEAIDEVNSVVDEYNSFIRRFSLY